MSAEGRNVAPTFGWFFVSGLETTIKESRTFTWRPVLSLALWVVDQPAEFQDERKRSWRQTQLGLEMPPALGRQERFYPHNPAGELARQQPVIMSLHSQFADSRDPHVL